MTGRRSRSARSAAGLALAATLSAFALTLVACQARGPARPPHPLEKPPSSADLVGRLEFHVARPEDTLIDLAPALEVGYVELLAANPGVDPWMPKGGTRLVLPRARLLPSGPREGIVVNLGDLRLYWFEKGKPPRSYPIGIAKDGYATPIGVTVVKSKKEKPTWIPGPSARADGHPERVEPGPDNPLGEHALYLGWPSYLIHGTNDPRGVGRHSSRGCIRLYPEHIAELYARVEPGTPVRVVNEPVKFGRIGGDLFVEVNPDPDASLELDETGKLPARGVPKDLREKARRAAGEDADRLDWPRIERAALRRSGVPTPALLPRTTRNDPRRAPAGSRL